MENKTDLMLEVFANYNTKKDPRVQSNKSYKGNSKYLGAENITTTFEIIEAIETSTIKKVETEKIMKSAEKNNIAKALEARGNLSERAKIIRLATDYEDPAEVEIDLSIDLMESFKRQYREMVKDGYKASFLDYLKSEIALKNKYKAGGIVK